MLVWTCGMLSDGVVENLVHNVNAKTVNSGTCLIFAKAVFANYFINASVIVAMQLIGTPGENCGAYNGCGPCSLTWASTCYCQFRPVGHDSP